MTPTIRIDARDVERELPEARRRVAAAGLPALLAEVDGGAFGTTALNLQVLEALAAAAAATEAALARPETRAGKGALAGILFAEEAAERLSALGERGAPAGPAELKPEEYRRLAEGDGGEAVAECLADAAAFLRFYRRHPDPVRRPSRDAEALACLRAHALLLGRTLRRLGAAPPDLAIETPRIRLRGLQASPTGGEEPEGLLPVTLDDIVGNEEFVKAGRRLARDVAGFDPASGKNPKPVRNPVLFVLGSPGCGKTVTAHALGRYFLDLCKGAGLPARFRAIRRTDWASSYQNQSARNLLDIFQKEVFEAEGVCGAYWPDIDTAFAARTDADIRQEEKAKLGAVFAILDGTVGPRTGKWFLICDANSVRMDEATLSRISQNPIRAKGPETAAHFVSLLRDIKLRGKGPWLPLSEAEWTAIGERCVREGLSGRAAEHLAGRILSEIEGFEEPPEYFSLPFEKKREMIAALSRRVPAARANAFLDDYLEFEREAQAESDRARFGERVREIRFHLSAQRAALGTA